MRKYLIAAAVLAAALATAAVAMAAQVNDATIKFSAKKAGAPTAIDSHFTVTNPSDPNATVTKHSREVDITFPKGIKFDNKGFPQCKTVQTGALERGACKKAFLAHGTSVVDARSIGLGFLHAKLTAFNGTNGLVILAVPKENAALAQVLQPRLAKNKLKTDLSAITSPTLTLDLTDFKLVIPKKHRTVRKHGKKTKVYYATLPKTCPKSKHWVVTVTYFFTDGTKFTTGGTKNACTPAKKKHKKH